MKVSTKIASSLLALGMASNVFALSYDLGVKTSNRTTILKSDSVLAGSSTKSTGYGIQANIQPMANIPVSIGANVSFWSADKDIANYSPTNLTAKEGEKSNSFKETKNKKAQAAYALEETLALNAWIPVEYTGNFKIKGSVGYTFAQQTHVHSGFKAEGEIKDGEATSITKDVTGSNNGFTFAFAPELSLNENTSVELAYAYDIRSMNMTAEEKGLEMKNNADETVAFEDKRDNTAHTFSAALNYKF
jgi:hypothetical protein